MFPGFGNKGAPTRDPFTITKWTVKERAADQGAGKIPAAVLALTGILDLDGGVWFGMGLVDHLRANLLSQNLCGEISKRR